MSGWHRADIFRCALAAAAPPRALDQVEGLTIGLMRSYSIDVVALAVAVVLAAATVLLAYQVVPDLTDLMMMPPPLSGG